MESDFVCVFCVHARVYVSSFTQYNASLLLHIIVASSFYCWQIFQYMNAPQNVCGLIHFKHVFDGALPVSFLIFPISSWKTVLSNKYPCFINFEEHVLLGKPIFLHIFQLRYHFNKVSYCFFPSSYVSLSLSPPWWAFDAVIKKATKKSNSDGWEIMGKSENAERGSYVMQAVLGKDYLWSKPELSHKYYGIHNFLILMIRLTGFKFRWISVCSYTCKLTCLMTWVYT